VVAAPGRPTGHYLDSQHRTNIRVAFGQRLAFSPRHAPPYRALYDTVATELADLPTIHHAAAGIPTHTGLDEAPRARACDWRPTRAGWLDVGPTAPTPPATPTRGWATEPQPWELRAKQDRYTVPIQPSGPGARHHAVSATGGRHHPSVIDTWRDGP
jgi:hypothetical protein